MKKTTIAVLLDAFRWDYLDPDDTPFLWRMKNKGVWAKKLFNPGGYCERSCFMTGAGPEITGNLFAFSLMQPGYKRAYFEPTFNLPAYLRTRLAMTEDVKPDTEPYSFGVESIWDKMREAGKSWQFEGCLALGIRSYKGRTTHGAREIFILDGLKEHKDFYYLQISETDQLAHLYGTRSKIFRNVLFWADRAVERIWKQANKEFDKVSLVVFGDHGMMDVKEKVDLVLDFSPYQENWDYLYLKSSAAVQFWVFNPAVEKEIFKDCQLNEFGKFIESPNPAQGDIIWQANPGVLVSPCHFHGREDAPVAMHGYSPDIDEMRGMAIVVDGRHKGVIEEADLRDICPTICDLVNIDYPLKNEGRSLCDTRRFQKETKLSKKTSTK